MRFANRVFHLFRELNLDERRTILDPFRAIDAVQIVQSGVPIA
jgi:hypothetical protein